MSAALPFSALIAEHREFGLVIAVVLGFCFGFVLERAGFGRADKLAAQFFLRDMTVFKVMFSAIITAMLGTLIAAGVGLVDLAALAQSVVSATYIWPMLVGGLLLGMGFILSGYCPGTSLVAAASGNIDGMVTFGGVIVGSLIYGEVFPLLADFHVAGSKGTFLLYDWLGMPPIVLGAIVTFIALAMFIGAERVEQIFAREGAAPAESAQRVRRSRRFVFVGLSGVALVSLVTLALPNRPEAAAPPADLPTISAEQLARRVVDRPWTVRVFDLRSRDACGKQRVPQSRCVPLTELARLGVPYLAPEPDLVVVDAGDLKSAPAELLRYRGRVLRLAGGFAAWQAYALAKPPALGATASADQREAYRFRAALHAALTGAPPAPPPPAAAGFAPKPKKKKGGGCS
ncbi:MAG: YeeE/YedE family protein [Deltaproteobacteria bacterium]|nr:YeeE/YedE family protein [Deltaproteobacteria bacterium]